MTVAEDNPSDEELADLMNESEGVDENEEITGGVEVGIPPAVDSEGSDLETEEETFSMDDFDSELTPTSAISQEKKSEEIEDVNEVASSSKESVSVETENRESPKSIVETESALKGHINGDGDVSEFRKTLANLSRQVEIEKLTHLHQSLSESGEPVPTLHEIAQDIQGNKSIFPDGDYDHYSKRPSARLEGWVSGLSFGVSKRAKKFSK